MINAVQIAPTWRLYFNNPQGALLGIMSSAYNLGAICALPLVPYVNDRFGRRWAIFLGSWIMVVGSVVQAFSISAGMYVGARFILGFGIPFCIIAGSSLMGELAYPKERPIMTSLFNALWFVGSLIAAGVSYGTQSLKDDWAWRIPSLLQAGPSLLQIVFIFMIPESPRFLISKDRREEAYATLITYHAEGATTSPFAAAEMAQIEHTIRIELEHSKRSWREMIAVPGLRKRVIIGSFLGLFTQWSGNTLLSYYLNQLLNMIGYDDPGFVGKVNVGLNSWNLMCYNIGYNALTYTFLVELFPFAQRTKGITIFQFFSRTAVFTTTILNPIGLKHVQGKWLIMYCAWLGFEIVFIYFMFPETYGRTLEELAFLFEDHALADEATTHVEKQMEWAERRWSRIDERMSWEMDVVVPSKARRGQGEGGNDVGTLDTRETVQLHQYRRRNSSWEDLRQRE
ncbi:hypothetical protein J4E83_010202 [Alternaria metachromatica]|uniref:uncharacterized protein n=1 Tax=Alternaria metachromatica TaxID=283354 RepID=UPI0020C2F775|nr:uncharacterized protein J4E83_010202 [Alternaria metachromatica]KAI4606181.1 hypothetical protein J4E83_010202 [Alternaria metachromatica]